MFNLNGKVAAVTGGGSGIGRAIATVFGRQGAHVIVLDLDGQAAGETAATVWPAAAVPILLRATCQMPTAWARRSNTIVASAGRLDILVNNAGVAHVGNIERTPEDDFDRLFRVNVKGVYLCSQAAVPVMVQPGWRRHSQHGVHRRVHRRRRSLCVLDVERGRADDDQVGGGGLRQTERPLQLHLPGAHSHTVR